MSWSTPTSPQPGAPQGYFTDENGINWQIILNDTGYVDQYAAAKSSLEVVLDKLATIDGGTSGGVQGFNSNSTYTP